MARPCAACSSPRHDEIDRKLRSGLSYTDAAVLFGIGRNALSRHARDHMGAAPRQPGTLPPSGDFLSAVRDRAWAAMEEGDLTPSITHGLHAQAQLDARAERMQDRDLFLKIAVALTGNVVPSVTITEGERAYIESGVAAQVDAIEAEFRPLLEAGNVPLREDIRPPRH